MSEESTLGMLNLGKISSNIFFTMTLVVSFLVWKASIHPEKVSKKTNKYLLLYLAGLTSVKSTFQYAHGQSTLIHLLGGGVLVVPSNGEGTCLAFINNPLGNIWQSYNIAV